MGWAANRPDGRVEVVAEGGRASGAWSTNHGFVAAVEDYLKHDIYVQKIVGRFNDLLVRTYGRNYARWRDVFSDRVLPEPVSRRRTRRREGKRTAKEARARLALDRRRSRGDAVRSGRRRAPLAPGCASGR